MDIRKIKPHAKDLRKGRHSENNRIYLITAVTYKRQKIFTDLFLGRIVIKAMQYQQQQKINSLAFVIMPDHFHWLFSLQNDHSLATIMQSVKGYSGTQIQKIRHEKGGIIGSPLWQDGYHNHAVRKEEDLQQIARYIVANPLRAKIVNKIRITHYGMQFGCRRGLSAATRAKIKSFRGRSPLLLVFFVISVWIHAPYFLLLSPNSRTNCFTLLNSGLAWYTPWLPCFTSIPRTNKYFAPPKCLS